MQQWKHEFHQKEMKVESMYARWRKEQECYSMAVQRKCDLGAKVSSIE
jgi:hypothetical protein